MPCRHRIATHQARFGLPPDAGGTVLLPAETALGRVAYDKPVTAPKTRDAGLSDEISTDDLAQHARA